MLCRRGQCRERYLPEMDESVEKKKRRHWAFLAFFPLLLNRCHYDNPPAFSILSCTCRKVLINTLHFRLKAGGLYLLKLALVSLFGGTRDGAFCPPSLTLGFVVLL